MDFTKDVRWKRIPLQDTVTCSRNCHLHNFISNYQLHNCNRNYHQDNWNRNCQLHNFNLNYYLHNYDRNWSGSTKKLDLKEQENNIVFSNFCRNITLASIKNIRKHPDIGKWFYHSFTMKVSFPYVFSCFYYWLYSGVGRMR